MKTGKIKKVAALDKVLQICNAHGASYNPGNESLQPTALRSLLQLAQEKTEAVNVTRSAYVMAINARKESFAGIPKLAAQIARMVSASKASEEDKLEAKLINRRFYSARKKKDNAAPILPGEQTLGVKSRSTSHRDRDGMLNTFHQLIQIVARIPNYKPNEPEFTVDGLIAKLAQLRAINEVASQAAIQFSHARIARDKVLQGAGGVIETTNAAKDYIRAKFGILSKEALETKPTMNF